MSMIATGVWLGKVVCGIDGCSFVTTGKNVLRTPNTRPLAAASTQSNPAYTPLVLPQHSVGGMATPVDLCCLWLRLRGIGGAAMAKANEKFLVISPCRVHSTAGRGARYQRTPSTAIAKSAKGSCVPRSLRRLCGSDSLVLAAPENKAEKTSRIGSRQSAHGARRDFGTLASPSPRGFKGLLHSFYGR